jgi:hypothetical protein
MYALAPNILDALKIIKPETVLRWHRAGFRAYWRWKARSRGGRIMEFREGGASSFLRRFLCSIWKPVSSSRPALRSRRRAQELSRLAVAPTLQHFRPFQAIP